MRTYIFTALFSLLSVISFAQEEIVSKEEVLEREKFAVLAIKVLDELPVFPGCNPASKNEAQECFQFKMQQHIVKNFRYPNGAYNRRIQGVVEVTYIISEDGTIKDIEAKGHELLVPEGIRIIKKLPKMKPGIKDGRPVKVKMSIPIIFKLN